MTRAKKAVEPRSPHIDRTMGAWSTGHACCCDEKCPMTLTTYIGGDQWMCWLHMTALGITREIQSTFEGTTRREP